MTEEDRRLTAYHEGGHAIVGMLTAGADPVRKISIIPRGVALGVTFSAPDSDRLNFREPELRAKIAVALGGRAAEELVFGETSTGAEGDIRQVTDLARQMVGSWGMSAAVGPIAVLPHDGAGPFAPPSEASPDTQTIVDSEVRRIVEEAHRQVVSLLQENRDKLDALADALLERETLDQEDAYMIAGVSVDASQTHVAASGASPRRT
jgi:cell division protease FtsH